MCYNEMCANWYYYVFIHVVTYLLLAKIVSDMKMVTPNSKNQAIKYRNVCTTCGKSYTSLGNLNKHCKFECRKENTFLCVMCKRKYIRKDHLERHLMIAHELNIKEIYNYQLIK